ncbi:MAG: PAS domain-containing protein [Alphaproteobacteria bacterium]
MRSTINYFYGDVIDRFLNDEGKSVFAYWNELRQDRPYPAKSEFDPSRVRKALPGMQIVEKVDPPVELRYRLVGTNEVDVRGWDPTGYPVSEGFVGPSVEIVLQHYRHTIATEAPLGVSGIFRKANDVWVEDISLFLPMGGATGDLQFIFVYTYYNPALPELFSDLGH